MPGKQKSARMLFGAKFNKASQYIAKAGEMARLKCARNHGKTCDLFVDVLISSVDSKSNETLDPRFIRLHRGKKHSNSCEFAYTNDDLLKSVNSFDEVLFKEVQQEIKVGHLSKSGDCLTRTEDLKNQLDHWKNLCEMKDERITIMESSMQVMRDTNKSIVAFWNEHLESLKQNKNELRNQIIHLRNHISELQRLIVEHKIIDFLPLSPPSPLQVDLSPHSYALWIYNTLELDLDEPIKMEGMVLKSIPDISQEDIIID